MSVTRPGKALRCAGCGKTGAEKQGANNWKMCDECFTSYCTQCFQSVRKSSTHCTDHSPWGKWLTGSGTFATMTFK
jgi:hypothetical protein